MRDAAQRLFETAIASIDLRTHEGVHPRIGAVDVVPFVPLDGTDMDECVRLAKDVARSVSDKFGLPVFLYEEAAATDERRNLADVRRGGLNGLAHRMKQPEWRPDFGPDRPHPSAGATAIGARQILIAYNINLATNRRECGQADCVGHPDQRRRSPVSSKRWASSSSIAASCRCR